MTSQILESRLSDDSLLRRRPATSDPFDELPEPVSSVLAAYRQQTSTTPYWPAASPSGDVIMTSYGVGGAGYVVHSGPSGLVSPWAAAPPSRVGADRLSELSGGGGGGYGSHMIGGVPALSAYAGGVDLNPWTANNYVPPPPSAVSPPFNAALPSLTGTPTRHALLSSAKPTSAFSTL